MYQIQMDPDSPGVSPGRAAVIAGIGLLAMAVLAPIANFMGVQELIEPGNGAATATNIMESEGLFRFGIAGLMVVVILDVLVAWALYIVFKSVNPALSLLTAWFRVVYAAILGVALADLMMVLLILGNDSYPVLLGESQLNARVLLFVDSFNITWNAGLLIFGLHLVLLGILAVKSGFVHRIPGYLVILAGLGYLADGLGDILIPGYDMTISMLTFIGEVILIFWLLIRGRKLRDAG